jgi:sucrose phosphorylase
VAALAGLCRFRNTHPAFGGECTVGGEGDGLTLTWTQGEHVAVLAVAFARKHATLTWTGADGATRTCADLLELATPDLGRA